MRRLYDRITPVLGHEVYISVSAVNFVESQQFLVFGPFPTFAHDAEDWRSSKTLRFGEILENSTGAPGITAALVNDPASPNRTAPKAKGLFIVKSSTMSAVNLQRLYTTERY